MSFFLMILGTSLLAFAAVKGKTASYYDLDIIGVAAKARADVHGPHKTPRLFVPIAQAARIQLSGGDFEVLNADGVQGTARFRLPATAQDETTYSVYAKALGQTSDVARIASCTEDAYTREEICSTLNYMTLKGAEAVNVENQLLFLYADLNKDGKDEKYALFDARLENKFWSRDDQGQQRLQLRFYPVAAR